MSARDRFPAVSSAALPIQRHRRTLIYGWEPLGEISPLLEKLFESYMRLAGHPEVSRKTRRLMLRRAERTLVELTEICPAKAEELRASYALDEAKREAGLIG